jgi:hypothetical protein
MNRLATIFAPTRTSPPINGMALWHRDERLELARASAIEEAMHVDPLRERLAEEGAVTSAGSRGDS